MIFWGLEHSFIFWGPGHQSGPSSATGVHCTCTVYTHMLHDMYNVTGMRQCTVAWLSSDSSDEDSSMDTACE